MELISRGVNSPSITELRYSFRDCCVAVSELKPTGKSRATLFFLHGRYGQTETWRPITQKLAREYRCVLVDLPGFGRSFTATGKGVSFDENLSLVIHLLERLSTEDELVILVGHDFGGALAQASVSLFPRPVEALILINSCCLTRDASCWATGFIAWKARWRLRRLLRSARQIELDFQEGLTIPWRVKAGRAPLIEAFRALECSWPSQELRKSWLNKLQEQGQPALLLWGKHDEINPPDIAAEMMKLLPDSYFFQNEDCGHWPYLESPDWVTSKIQEFIFRISLYRPGLRAQRSLSR